MRTASRPIVQTPSAKTIRSRRVSGTRAR
jgi:hypothetical protein